MYEVPLIGRAWGGDLGQKSSSEEDGDTWACDVPNLMYFSSENEKTRVARMKA